MGSVNISDADGGILRFLAVSFGIPVATAPEAIFGGVGGSRSRGELTEGFDQ